MIKNAPKPEKCTVITYLFTPILDAFLALGCTSSAVENEQSEKSSKHATKDADSHQDVYPDGEMCRSVCPSTA